MAKLKKDYYALEEVEEGWGISRHDLVYLAENGLLRLSVRLYGIQVELGSYDVTVDGEPFSIPENHVWFEGLQDLRRQDVYRLFRDGKVQVSYFETPADQYCCVITPEDGIIIGKDELVIRKEERDRVESRHGLGGVPRTTKTAFSHKNGFTEVTLGVESFTFGPFQAEVIRILYDAATTSSPWRHGKLVLAEAGSSCTRMSDLFKSQPGWRKLIQSDRRGRYRLNIKFV